MAFSASLLWMVLLAVLSSVFLCGAVSWTTEKRGTVSLAFNDFQLLDSHCFARNTKSDTPTSNVTWAAWATKNNGTVTILFYDDQASSYPAVLKNKHKLTCQEKMALAKTQEVLINGWTYVQPLHDPHNQHTWYIVAATCNAPGTIIDWDFLYDGKPCSPMTAGMIALTVIMVLFGVSLLVIGGYFGYRYYKNKSMRSFGAQNWQSDRSAAASSGYQAVSDKL